MIAIAAMSENGVIGCNNSIPWHIQKIFDGLKKKTMGGILVMGRKTFESIGKVLRVERLLLYQVKILMKLNKFHH